MAAVCTSHTRPALGLSLIHISSQQDDITRLKISGFMRCIPVGIGFFHLQLRQQDYHDYHHNQREPQVQEIKHIDAGLGLYRRICHVAAGRKKPSCRGLSLIHIL